MGIYTLVEKYNLTSYRFDMPQKYVSNKIDLRVSKISSPNLKIQ